MPCELQSPLKGLRRTREAGKVRVKERDWRKGRSLFSGGRWANARAALLVMIRSAVLESLIAGSRLPVCRIETQRKSGVRAAFPGAFALLPVLRSRREPGHYVVFAATPLSGRFVAGYVWNAQKCRKKKSGPIVQRMRTSLVP